MKSVMIVADDGGIEFGNEASFETSWIEGHRCLTFCNFESNHRKPNALMSTSKTFVIRPENDEQEIALKAFIKALKMKFEVFGEDPYDKAFVRKIEESREDYQKGNYTRIAKEDLEEYLGLK